MDFKNLFFPNGPPLPALPPEGSDPTLVHRIRKLAEFGARNGPSFVEEVRSKQHDNAEYAFLNGGEGSDFWKWTLHCELLKQAHGSSQHQKGTGAADVQAPRSAAARSQETSSRLDDRSIAIDTTTHPVAAEAAPSQPSQAYNMLSENVVNTWSHILRTLSPSQEAISSAQNWFASCDPKFVDCLVSMMAQQASAVPPPYFEPLISLVYLMNDILLKYQASGKLPSVLSAFMHGSGNGIVPFRHIVRCASRSAAGIPERCQALVGMVTLWGQRHVIDQSTCDQLMKEIQAFSGGLYQPGNLHLHRPILPSTYDSQPVPSHTTPTHQYGNRGPAWPGVPHGVPSGQYQANAYVGESGSSVQAHFHGPRPVVPSPQPPPSSGHLDHSLHHLSNAPHPSPPGWNGAQPIMAWRPQGDAQNVITPHMQPPPPSEEEKKPAFDPFSFPPGLIPHLVEEKLKTDPPYSPLSPLDIEQSPVPPLPNEDDYLKARLDTFYAQLADYRPGVAFSDLQEGPEAALAPPLPSRSSRARAGKIPIVVQPGGGAAIQPMLGNEFTRKGSESATVGLGFAGSNEDDAHRDDVFSAYRRMRSTSYHSTIAREVLEKRQNRR